MLSGHGNNGKDGYEGVRRGNVIGTYLHGPLLPKNAWLADRLIELALGIELEPLDDRLEDAAHGSARRAGGRLGSNAMAERAFVTGGSGFIGGALIRRLVADGHEVRALARSDRSADAVRSLGAEPVKGELGDRASLARGAAGCELRLPRRRRGGGLGPVGGLRRGQRDRDPATCWRAAARRASAGWCTWAPRPRCSPASRW